MKSTVSRQKQRISDAALYSWGGRQACQLVANQFCSPKEQQCRNTAMPRSLALQLCASMGS
jgi:hypothetical protein